MAKKPREQGRADAGRIGKSGTGKLDAPAAKPARAPRRRDPDTRHADVPDALPAGIDEARERLTRERNAAVARLQALRVSPEFDEQASPGGNESMEEGDAAQASERRDMSFTTRERVARRINVLTAALERIERGEYGRCSVCGSDIEPERLRAIPEAATCLRCQERLERTGTPEQAA